ncbi:magnesium transporter [Sulfurovum sp. zt1-1]|uniref:Magnesium transporter n=1 Tax=Sulfurovum zhangzhouensis TaxID=3019067 RepID=A0ABT7QXZ8_9BACT|nr:CorA family divalent cation transporter [Sulfurovum zhangzhouensis]MDM5271709.1 magnesium transporter [Sulfurovum zhangzhouensis]
MQNTELNIDALHHEDLDNPLHPSIFDRNEGYDILIIRLPILKKLHEIDMVSFGFVISESTSYFYHKTSRTLEILPKRFESIYEMLDKKIDDILKFFRDYQDEILLIEEKLYAQNLDKEFMSRWLRHKKDIVRIERVMQLTADELKDFIEVYEHHNDFPVNHYYDLLEHCERIHRSASLQLTKLDYIYNFYTTRTAEKMNRIIFLLTIISGVFLPLNLFVGYFGMNTSGLPFTAAGNGTMKVSIMMAFIMMVSIFLVVLWRKRMEKNEL